MLIRLVPIGLVLLLLSCGGPTRQALEGALIQEGDLPAGYVAGQISDGATMSGHMEGFDQRVMRDIQAPGGPGFVPYYVVVALYTDRTAQARDFDRSLAGLTADGHLSHEVGEQARIRDNIIMFIRCGALVQMQFGIPQEALAYAKRLDGRLSSIVC
jgi:hypothetical protein